MTFVRKSGGSSVNVAAVKVRKEGAWATPGFVRRRSGGAWVDLAVPGGTSASIIDRSIFSGGPNGTRVAGYQVNADGTTYTKNALAAGGYVGTGETWRLVGTSGLYEVRATLLSGSAPAGVLNTWANLSASQTWSVSSSGLLVSCSLRIEIRDAASGVVLDSATINLSAERA